MDSSSEFFHDQSLILIKTNAQFKIIISDFSSGLKFNLELILFKSPWAPFNQVKIKVNTKKN